MQINRCPKCMRKPDEPEGCFRYDSVIDRMRFLGWRVTCINCGFHTEVHETIDKAVAKWNELTNKIKGE